MRIGNAASEQFQLDVYGELLDATYLGEARDCTESKPSGISHERWSVMSKESGRNRMTESGRYVADAVTSSIPKSWRGSQLTGSCLHYLARVWSRRPLERWIRLRNDMHDEICRLGFSHEVNSFVQYYGSKELDASLLILPLVGFLPPEDPRIQGTVAAIEKNLMKGGFVARYNTRSAVDGLSGDEGVFLACSFWMVDNYVLQHRIDEARALFERLLSLRNDVGLLSEEYDPKEHRQLGNFPQAFSHLALVNSAHNLTASTESRPARHRSRR